MSVLKYLSWENFASTVFVRGQQRVHRATDSPSIEIFGDGVRNRIGIWLEVPVGTQIPQEIASLAFITAQTLTRNGLVVLEVATATPSLFRQFYHFAVAVAERVIVEKSQPLEAIILELQCFTDLMEAKSFLAIERQIGLLGELVFLQYLLVKEGVDALDAWLGPLGEPHDFRVKNREFEVKTTVATHRIHTIHGTEQLVPSEGCTLYLLSVLLGPAGMSDGFSLADKVSQVSNYLTLTPRRLTQFETALGTTGYREDDRVHYARRFALRRPIGLVRVDNSFPAITRPTIQAALGPLASRIEALQYDVNVEGLEHEDGTEEFTLAIMG
jgi:hypothetical protein